MLLDKNKVTIKRLYEDGWGKGHLDIIDQVFAEKHVLHWNDLNPIDQNRTTYEVKSIVENYRKSFPDLKVEINHIIAEGDFVVVQVTFIGTHMYDYEGFKATNKKSRFTDIQILKMQDGKIIESNLASGGLDYFYKIISGAIFNSIVDE